MFAKVAGWALRSAFVGQTASPSWRCHEEASRVWEGDASTKELLESSKTSLTNSKCTNLPDSKVKRSPHSRKLRAISNAAGIFP